MSNIKSEHNYHFIYKTINKTNGKIYIGVHNTNNLNDSYFGSGVALRNGIKKYGKESFKREIVEYFTNPENAFNREEELVNEAFIKRVDTYNMRIGGDGGAINFGKVAVRDKNGKTFQVAVDDPRYLNGELVGVTKGKVAVRDKDGKTYQVAVDDPRYLNGELFSHSCGKIVVKDESGNIFQVNVDDKNFIMGNLKHINNGKLVVRDKDGKTFQVAVDDPRYLSGEFVSINKGKKLQQIICPHCCKSGDNLNMLMNHFDYCLKNPNMQERPKRKLKVRICPWCGKIGKGPALNRWHFDNCKENPKNKPS